MPRDPHTNPKKSEENLRSYGIEEKAWRRKEGGEGGGGGRREEGSGQVGFSRWLVGEATRRSARAWREEMATLQRQCGVLVVVIVVCSGISIGV